MKRFKSISLILTAMLWCSCTDHIVYHSYHHFPQEGWGKSDTIIFHLHLSDSVPGNAEITFLIRNQSNYPYQDFNAILQHNMPDSTRWRSFKLNFTLTDKNGRWTGSGWAGLYQSPLSLGQAHVHSGTYTFKVVHEMPDKYLKGINDIGILIEKEKRR
ncbi:MAG: gliding motility lipoprotein GldH [Mediterranea sp.]|nr:gliding motility lipoprotein GldH [Mediterranea sp.]